MDSLIRGRGGRAPVGEDRESGAAPGGPAPGGALGMLGTKTSNLVRGTNCKQNHARPLYALTALGYGRSLESQMRIGGLRWARGGAIVALGLGCLAPRAAPADRDKAGPAAVAQRAASPGAKGNNEA